MPSPFAPSASTASPTPTPACGRSASTPPSPRMPGQAPITPSPPWATSALAGPHRPRCVEPPTGVRPSSRSTRSWLSCSASPPTSCARCIAPSSPSYTATTTTSTPTTRTAAWCRTPSSRCGARRAMRQPASSPTPMRQATPTSTTCRSRPMTVSMTCASPTLSLSVDWRLKELIHE